MRKPSKFEQPIIDPKKDRFSWFRVKYELREDYSAEWISRDGDLCKLTVAAGFRLDGSSEWILPFVFGWIPYAFVLARVFNISQDGLQRAGSLIHDRIYRTAGDVALFVWVDDGWRSAPRMDRAAADWAFLALCLRAEMDGWQSKARHSGVRALGPWRWWRAGLKAPI